LSFLRHRKIYQSDGLKRELNYSFSSPQTIVPMSLQPAIPSWVALQQSPRPLRRFSTASRLTLLLYSLQQPTATVPIFQCLNSGVHSILSPICLTDLSPTIKQTYLHGHGTSVSL
jgi:hypothetical protein